jgi:hypothetical protein
MTGEDAPDFEKLMMGKPIKPKQIQIDVEDFDQVKQQFMNDLRNSEYAKRDTQAKDQDDLNDTLKTASKHYDSQKDLRQPSTKKKMVDHKSHE